jgi:hypothetical protein
MVVSSFWLVGWLVWLGWSRRSNRGVVDAPRTAGGELRRECARSRATMRCRVGSDRGSSDGWRHRVCRETVDQRVFSLPGPGRIRGARASPLPAHDRVGRHVSDGAPIETRSVGGPAERRAVARGVRSVALVEVLDVLHGSSSRSVGFVYRHHATLRRAIPRGFRARVGGRRRGPLRVVCRPGG